MVKEHRIKIVVIAEDMRLQDYMVMLLVGEGYEVKAFATQNEALIHLDNETTDLIISEFQSPNINGLDLCKILRKNVLYNYIPIFFIIPDTQPLTAARLIYAGADDYINRSTLEDELFLKVKLNLYRVARQKQDINNVTKLPGRDTLLKELQKRIELKDSFAIHYAEIYGINEFACKYGFETKDTVIKYTASLIFKTMREMGDISDFLCHYSTNEFIFLTLTDNLEGIGNRILKEFDSGIAAFYNEEDKKTGTMLFKTRFGEAKQMPLMRICIGITTNSYFPLFSPLRIIQIAAEVKQLTQQSETSLFIKEDRKNYSI